jgi:hypothetical protein
MFFDEGDLAKYPHLNRKLNRTARMYSRVKSRCYLNDSDKNYSWPELIEEELVIELNELEKENALLKIKNKFNSEIEDDIYEINKKKGIIKKRLKTHYDKQAISENQLIDPISGEKKEIERDNLLLDSNGENYEKFNDEQWQSSSEFKQMSISMSVIEGNSQFDEQNNDINDNVKHKKSSEDINISLKNIRQRAAMAKRRKAVVKVTLMDPFASQGCKSNIRMQYNSKKEVIKPIIDNGNDRFNLIQPEQIEWRKKNSHIKYELSSFEEPRIMGSRNVQFISSDEKLTEVLNKELDFTNDNDIKKSPNKFNDNNRSVEKKIEEEHKIEEISEKKINEEVVIIKDDDSYSDSEYLSVDSLDSEQVDYDSLYTNGLINEEEYDRLKVIRAEKDLRKIEKEKKNAILKEVSSIDYNIGKLAI